MGSPQSLHGSVSLPHWNRGRGSPPTPKARFPVRLRRQYLPNTKEHYAHRAGCEWLHIPGHTKPGTPQATIPTLL